MPSRVLTERGEEFISTPKLPHGIKFDMTFNFGTLIQIITLVITILYASNKIENRMTTLEVKVDKMWSSFTIGGR